MTRLPQSPDAELGLLSSFLLDPQAVGRLCAERKIGKAHFHLPAHSLVFGVLLEMWSEERPIDFILLTTILRDRNQLDGCGGPAFITQLFTFLPTASLAAYYLDILQEKLVLRQIITVCNEYGARSYTDQHDFPNILGEVQARIAGIGSHQAHKIPTMKENIMEALDTLEGRVSEGTAVVHTGLAALDRDVGPLERGNLFVIGGQTKAGKSMLAGQVALNIAMSGKPVLFISLEMSERELTLRLLSILARVDTRTVKFWNDHEHARFAAAQTTLLDAPLQIVTRRYKLSEIAGICQQAAARPGEPLAAVVLDYAQLTEGSRSRKDEMRHQELAEISRTCKRLAGSLNVLFLLLTQLNDEGRTRESRDIENDANLMVEVGHNRETGERGVKVVLARSAPSGQRLKLRIIPEHTRVEDAPDMNVEPDEETQPKGRRRNWHQ